MTTRSFLRQEMKRDMTVRFRLNRREYEDLFLIVVDTLAERHRFRAHGRQTSVFLLLLRNALFEHQNARKTEAWREQEAAFVRLTREQEVEIATLRTEIHMKELEIKRLRGDDERLTFDHDFASDACEIEKPR